MTQAIPSRPPVSPAELHALTLFMISDKSATAQCSCGQEFGVAHPDALRGYWVGHRVNAGIAPGSTLPRESVQWPLVYDVPGVSPASVPDDDAPMGDVIDVVPGALVRRPRYAKRAPSSPAGVQALKAGAGLLKTAGLDADLAIGLATAHSQEDLDQAAQAVVDAADVWEDSEGDIDVILALSDAVKHWRKVRDGGAR